MCIHSVFSRGHFRNWDIGVGKDLFFSSQIYPYNTWDSCNYPKRIFISNMSGDYFRTAPQIFTWSFKLINSEVLHIPYLIIHIHWQENGPKPANLCWIFGIYLEKSLLNWLISELKQKKVGMHLLFQSEKLCWIKDHNLNTKMQSSCNHDHSFLCQIHKV